MKCAGDQSFLHGLFGLFDVFSPVFTLTVILEKLEDKLSARSGEKPVGGIDLSGVHDQTNMAVDELFDGESELSN